MLNTTYESKETNFAYPLVMMLYSKISVSTVV